MASSMRIFLVIVACGLVSIGIYLAISTEVMKKLSWKLIRNEDMNEVSREFRVVQVIGNISSNNMVQSKENISSSNPVQAQESLSPSKLVQSQENISPSKPVQSQRSISPSKPVQSQQSISPSKPVQSQRSISPSKPVQSQRSISPSKPVQSQRSISLSKPVQSQRSISPSKPVQSQRSISPSKPVQSQRSISLSKPVQSEDNISSSNHSKNHNKALVEKSQEEEHDANDVKYQAASYLTDGFLQNNRDGSYPSLLPCPYTRLRKTAKNPVSRATLGCAPHQPSKGSCEDAARYFGKPDQQLEERKCDETSYPDICSFTKTKDNKDELNCDAKSCGSSEVNLGAVDPKIGVITKWEPIKPFSTAEVRKYVDKKIDEKHNFCFIKCGSILQALIFPPRIITNKKEEVKKKININIVVLDSISRPHFFRVMRESVAAMRKIIYDESINATVLDFELFQSISMHTFGNIRSLFSGIIQGNDDFSKASASTKPLGINVLNTEFKKHGYQTMFQEDLCWHDSWGTMLSNIKAASGAVNEKTWQEFQNIVKQHNLDHIGITHFSCEVLKKYGLTNHYDRPAKVCLNGKFYNVYFLKYIEDIFKAMRSTSNSAPMFLYQHFNSGHTDTGSRIRNDDRGLVEFIHNMASNSNTLTILMADHGHTRTGYGVTDEGKHELYHPLLFMIVPYRVADLLGKKRMEALVVNQHRLLSAYDLHTALMSLNDEKKKYSVDYKENGVFSKIPTNRTCSDVPLMPLARCQCEGADSKVQDNSNSHRWLAEFALGTLNNIIQDQYSKGIDQKSTIRKGYGNCVRMTGTSFRNIIQSNTGYLTQLDLHVDSKNIGLKEDEIFTVAVELKGDTPTLKSYTRQTLYNKFKDCVDKTVDIKICACDKTKINPTVRVLKPEEMKSLVSKPMFETETQIKDLHGGCLFQITRHHSSKISIVYEVANSCAGQTFKVTVRGSLYYVFTSRPFPFEQTVEPNSIYFMFSAARQILGHSHMDITISATKV